MKACAFVTNEEVKRHAENVGAFEEKMRRIEEDFDRVSGSGFFRIDKPGFMLVGTSKRWADLKKKNISCIGGLDTAKFTSKAGGGSGTSVHIFHPVLDELGRDFQHATNALNELQQAKYKEFMEAFAKKHASDVHSLCTDIKNTDFHVTCAYLALKYNYTKPDVHDNETPFISAKGLRHPIVERIEEETGYVGNDVSLGNGLLERGWLLYGLNAAGKSTLMKSIALSVWMAQAGMYVPASAFTFAPFSAIFSRITRGDNIYEGQSTFMVEVRELRNIIHRADSRSLVIGDELCSGTEAASAIGIVTAGLSRLTKIGACFIFATHLHDLTSISHVKEMISKKALGVYHLHVEYDHESGKLIYDRRLRPGQGDTLYGIEVCKALDIGEDFMNLAMVARKEYLASRTLQYPTTGGDVFDAKPSSYNASVRIQTCAICKQRGGEVHHIAFQKDADKNGFIGSSGTHKNHSSNLVVLCEACHMNVHKKGLCIKGYVKTSNGVELVVEQSAKQPEKENELVAVIQHKRFIEKKSLATVSRETGVSQYQVKKALKVVPGI